MVGLSQSMNLMRIVSAVVLGVGWTALSLGQQPGYPHSFGQQGLGMPPSIQAMVQSEGGVIYAGSFGMGVFFSQDHGKTWESFNQGLNDAFVLCLTVDPRGTIYAGTVKSGVFRRKIGDETWESISRGLRKVEVKALLSHKARVFAGTGEGVYSWNEEENSWRPAASGLEQVLVSSLVMFGEHTLLAGTAGKGLFQLDLERSLNEAQWVPVGQRLIDPLERLSHRFIRIVAVNADFDIYVGTQDGGIFVSRDSGGSWRPYGHHLPNDSIRSIVAIGESVLVATGKGIYRTDGGRRWVPAHSGITDLSIQVLIGGAHGVFYAGTSTGAFRSDDGGQTWHDISEGLGVQASIPRPFF